MMILRNNKMGARVLRFSLKFLGILCVFFIPVLSASAGGVLPAPVVTHATQPRKPSFYVNAGLGIDLFSSPITDLTSGLRTAGPGPVIVRDLSHVTRMINSSTTVSLGVGYVFPVKRWFNLGARVFVRYANNFDSVSGSRANDPGVSFINSNTRVKLRHFEYGIDLTPSVNIGANQFLTGIFGIAFNRARLSNTSEVFSTTALAPGTVQSSMRRSVTGLRLGYSVEELLNRYFGVYMTYIWTGYGSVHLLQSVPIATFRSDSGINFQTHNIMLGLKYYFSPQNYVRHLRAMANAFNRFYIRFAIGTLIPQFQSSGEGQDQASSTLPIVKSDQNGNQGAPAPMGILGLGYGFLIHHFYLGVETLMNVNFANRISKSELNTGANAIFIFSGADGFLTSQNSRIRLNTVEAAFDLKLGGIIAPQTLFIGRVGIAVNHILLQNSREIIDAANNFLFINQRISKTVVGLRFGLGIEKLFSDNVSLAMNYVYTYYGHISGGAQSNPIVPYSISSTDARVATHAVTIGVNYYFS